jgi:hypothetical protein
MRVTLALALRLYKLKRSGPPHVKFEAPAHAMLQPLTAESLPPGATVELPARELLQ